MPLFSCKVCQHQQEGNIFTIKEMQLGFREDFQYLLCEACGCMQLLTIPQDLSKYYPNTNYYSFSSEGKQAKATALNKIRTAYLLHGKHKILGWLLASGYTIPEYMDWVKIPGVDFNDKILDVGTGSGQLLLDLYKNGFNNLHGIDPFIDREINYGPFQVKKKDIFEVHESFDLIMLHHVFEHVDEPAKVLEQLYKLLNPGKFLVIRTPVMGMYGWKTYGTNWVGLDAPRHLLIHSLQSMKMLAENAGFKIIKTVFDSVAYHFLASEQYKNDVALMEPNSFYVNLKGSQFNKDDVKKYKALAKKTNQQGMGDQAAFYLVKQNK
jgi:2-polyprenyl-3-methyl-5-hydroxy-6-metoxy-1,4-benzoquinol methylase